jgi:hypothetical protein
MQKSIAGKTGLSGKRVNFSVSLAKSIIEINKQGLYTRLNWVKKCESCNDSDNTFYLDGLGANLEIFNGLKRAKNRNLFELQAKFTLAFALLIVKAKDIGFDPAIAMVRRCKNCKIGKVNSVHKLCLAGDLILYKDGNYLTNGEYYSSLHDFWDTLGGSERIVNDMNHFSMMYKGVR